MVNRELIRLKAVQLAYAALLNGEDSAEHVEKELLFSLQKTFDLYHSMLQLMVDLYRVGCKRLATEEAKIRRTGYGNLPSPRFADNRFIKQLEENEELRSYCDDQRLGWMDEEEFLARTFRRITESDYYNKKYLGMADSYLNDQLLWRAIYRNEIVDNGFIDDHLERQSLYWNDDRHIVDSFVLKTIKSFSETDDKTHELLPQYRSDEDKAFAVRLIRCAIAGASTYRQMIADNATAEWPIDRLATMDVVIMIMALAEVINFPEIAVGVTLNEYIELSKYYSTPQSSSYINGMLNAIISKLNRDGIVDKRVR